MKSGLSAFEARAMQWTHVMSQWNESPGGTTCGLSPWDAIQEHIPWGRNPCDATPRASTHELQPTRRNRAILSFERSLSSPDIMLSAIERYAYKSSNLWDTTYKTKPMRHGLQEAAYETQLLKWTYKMQPKRCIRAVAYFGLLCGRRVPAIRLYTYRRKVR